MADDVWTRANKGDGLKDLALPSTTSRRANVPTHIVDKVCTTLTMSEDLAVLHFWDHPHIPCSNVVNRIRAFKHDSKHTLLGLHLVEVTACQWIACMALYNIYSPSSAGGPVNSAHPQLPTTTSPLASEAGPITRQMADGRVQ